jgi:hypothetical protein
MPNIIMTRPYSQNLSTITIGVNDPELQEGLAQYETLEEKREYVEDAAEIGARVIDNHREDKQTVSLLTLMESHQRQDRAQHQAELKQLREAHQQQLELSEKQRISERAEQSQQMEQLNKTVARMSEQLAFGARKSQEAMQGLQIEATDLLDRVGEELLNAIRSSNQDADSLVGIIQETLGSATDHVKQHIQSASVLLRTYQDREKARMEAEEMKEGASSRKGADFESRILHDLSAFADHRSDTVIHTGNDSEKGTTSKKGDLIYTMTTPRGPVKIALELKDDRLYQSGQNPYFLPSLRAAKEERGAKYGIVVASLDENSRRDGTPRFMPLKSLGDNNYVVLVDEEQQIPIALLAALQMIGNLEARQDTHQLRAEKIVQVERRLQKISEITTRLKGMKTSANMLQDNLSGLQDTLVQFDRELKAEVRGLEELLKKGY